MAAQGRTETCSTRTRSRGKMHAIRGRQYASKVPKEPKRQEGQRTMVSVKEQHDGLFRRCPQTGYCAFCTHWQTKSNPIRRASQQIQSSASPLAQVENQRYRTPFTHAAGEFLFPRRSERFLSTIEHNALVQDRIPGRRRTDRGVFTLYKFFLCLTT